MKTVLSVVITLLLQSNNTLAASGSGSIEFMCKAKAKEVAAETYSGCINDNKQAELERIRKEYQAELAKVKAKYNSELQSLGGGSNSPTVSLKKAKTGARASAPSASTMADMPAKKLKTSKVRTEKIDFSSDSNEKAEENSDSSSDADLGYRANEGVQTLSATEIVEIPPQEE